MLLCVHTRYNLFAHSSCTSVFILIFINPQYTVLHILSHCTSYSLLYLIICSYFHSHLYLYIFSCVMCQCFIFYVFYFFHFPLSGPVLTYISLLIIPCMIVYVTNNKEPWTSNLMCSIYCLCIDQCLQYVPVTFLLSVTKQLGTQNNTKNVMAKVIVVLVFHRFSLDYRIFTM